MWHKEVIPDKTINQKVAHELSARGMRAPCNIAVQTTRGVVTLSGCIEYEHQRNAAVQAARHLDGVTRVVDQLRVKPKTSPWKMEPTKPAPAPVAPIAPPVEEPPKADEAADPHLAENAAALSGTA